ncbi:MAG: NAD(+) synthase [Polyangia bacterium]|jgi:NAD+ synthase (glutamine-hydrolysing)|nr:NAD(+) synthase [Polyangia bacterium]
MRYLKVGAAVLNQTPLDWEGNARRIRGVLEEAAREDVQLLCLPELCITGYGCEDAFLSPGVADAAREVLGSLLPHTSGRLVSFGLPVWYRKALYNAACLVSDGRIMGFVAKQHLAASGIHYEPRWFSAWPEGALGEISWDGSALPLGDLVFEADGVRIGFEICEDAWVASRPGGSLAARGVDILLNPSASHFALGKHAVRQRLVLEGSRAFGVAYVYANLLGNESGRAIYDGGALVASLGEPLASGPRFSFAEGQLTTASVDVDATRTSRPATSRPGCELSGGVPVAGLQGASPALVEVPFSFEERDPTPPRTAGPAWEQSSSLKEEELTRAVALGLFDYLRKSGSRGFVVSLSGGADSSAVAVLVATLVRLALEELGPAELASRLPFLTPILEGGEKEGGEEDLALLARRLVKGLLTTAYQSTRNSGAATRHAARSLAEALGAEHHDLDVDPLVQGYLELGAKALGRPLTWEEDDLAMQNIQARVRAPGVWLLANVKRALLLSTSNRSEAAVGYATMDGDTCGGLSPIAGIDKAFLLRWLRWMAESGPSGLGPTPALEAVTSLAPTAELKPPEEHQTDEADLMPYPLLDAIERAAVRDRLSPLEAFRRLGPRFSELPPRRLAFYVERFFRLFAQNQWKRERYAPSFHLDDENLDPKTWCRFPILSGCFAREIAALRAYVDERYPAPTPG